MGRYEIALKKTEPSEGLTTKHEIYPGALKKLSDDLLNKVPEIKEVTAFEKEYLGDMAEACFVIACRLTGNTSSSIPTSDTIKVATLLMHLPDHVAHALNNKIQRQSYGSL